LTVELSSPPTYWIGLETDGRNGSKREKTLVETLADMVAV